MTLAETRRGGGGGGGRGGEREILAVSCGGGGGGVTQYAPVAMGDTSRDTQGGDPSRSYAERS